MPVAPNLENTTAVRIEWRTFRDERPNYASERTRRVGFLRYMARKTGEDLADVTAALVFCKHCSTPTPNHATSTTQIGPVCSDCVNAYAECSFCEQLTQASMQVNTLSGPGRMICTRCVAAHHRYCYACRGHYPRYQRANHNHGNRGCCESPDRVFTIPHIGHDPLQNDTRIYVNLPQGEISSEGIEQIREQIGNQAFYDDWNNRPKWALLAEKIDHLGVSWQTKQGNYSKRLSSYAYKEHGLKLPPTLLTMVGNIARDNSNGKEFRVEVTRDLNLGARSFGYPGSCWWQSYSRGRCALKTNGGFGIRTFTPTGGVRGRAWVMPLRLTDWNELTPTFDTMNAVAFVLFNGYGDLTGYAPVRVMSHITGMTYRKIHFTCQPMYVNSSAGYLLAGEELASRYTDGTLNLVVSQHSSLYDTENRQLVDA